MKIFGEIEDQCVYVFVCVTHRKYTRARSTSFCVSAFSLEHLVCAEFCCHLDDKTDQNRCRRLVSDVKQSIQLKRQILKHPIYSKITFKVSADFENVTHGRAH